MYLFRILEIYLTLWRHKNCNFRYKYFSLVPTKDRYLEKSAFFGVLGHPNAHYMMIYEKCYFCSFKGSIARVKKQKQVLAYINKCAHEFWKTVNSKKSSKIAKLFFSRGGGVGSRVDKNQKKFLNLPRWTKN